MHEDRWGHRTRSAEVAFTGCRQGVGGECYICFTGEGNRGCSLPKVSQQKSLDVTWVSTPGGFQLNGEEVDGGTRQVEERVSCCRGHREPR